MFTSTHSFATLDARMEAHRQAYALVKAAADTLYPLSAAALLKTTASAAQEPSQSWRGDNFIKGTGEGYFKQRYPQGTRLDKILCEPQPHPDFTPWIMTVREDATAGMVQLAYVRNDDTLKELHFEPTMQDAVNQPVDTLKKGDTVVCFQEQTDKDEVDFDELKFYAIKLAPSSDCSPAKCLAFLNAYKAAGKEFDELSLTARMVATTDLDHVVKARKRKAHEAEKEAARKRHAEE
jgi:hypothetical protein